MRNKQRIALLENKIQPRIKRRPAYCFPSEILYEKDICYKIIQRIEGDQSDNKSGFQNQILVMLPDNKRGLPNQEDNKIIEEVLIEEKREDLLQYIRWE